MRRRGGHSRGASAGKRRSNLDEVNVRRRRGTQKEIYDVDFDKRRVGYFEPINDSWKVTHSRGVTYLDSPGDAIELLVEKGAQAKATAARIANRARREHVDLVTGTPVRPGTRGAVETGRYVMRVRPEKGEPFEVVVVESEDLDPAGDVLGTAPALKGYYEAQAQKSAKQGKRGAKQRAGRLKRLESGRVKGVRLTFSSPREGAQKIYDFNHAFYDPITEVSDPGDVVDDWFDRQEILFRGRHRALKETPRGRELYEAHQRGFGPDAVVETLAYVLGKTKNRRWEDVDWRAIEEYNDQLRKAYLAEEAHGHGVAGWKSDFEAPLPARGIPTEEEAVKAPRAVQEQYMWLEARDELERVAERMEAAYKANRKHIKDTKARKTIRERIKQVRAWAEDPASIPPWACVAGEVYCDFPGPWRELEEIEGAAEDGYNPDWPLQELAAGRSAVELGVFEGAAPRVTEVRPVEEDLDVPWEVQAANPHQVNFGKLKRRLLR